MGNGLALVTGASSGIGYELAKVLAGKGYDLIVSSAGGRLPDAASEMEGRGARVTKVSADLATREGVKTLWKEVQSAGGNLEVACLNAGVGVGGLFAVTDLDAELNMVQLTARARCSSRSMWCSR